MSGPRPLRANQKEAVYENSVHGCRCSRKGRVGDPRTFVYKTFTTKTAQRSNFKTTHGYFHGVSWNVRVSAQLSRWDRKLEQREGDGRKKGRRVGVGEKGKGKQKVKVIGKRRGYGGGVGGGG